MLLRLVLESLLREQGAEVIEFPNDNFTLSVFRDKKALLFTPQYHHSITNKIRTLITMLKESFRILRVNDRDLGSFEVEVDPREDFDAVVEFIRGQAGAAL